VLYLVGMGLEPGDMTLKGREAVLKAGKVFIETYTSMPYDIGDLQKEITSVDREFVEKGDLLELAGTADVVLLIPGDPLFATTHISLMKEARDKAIPLQVCHAPSVINTLSHTGLSPYKFGRIITLSKPFPSDREKLEANLKAGLHTLCLLDPIISLSDGLRVLQDFGVTQKVVACQQLGMKTQTIHYGTITDLLPLSFSKKPCCLLVPADLHFFEEEFLNQFIHNKSC